MLNRLVPVAPSASSQSRSASKRLELVSSSPRPVSSGLLQRRLRRWRGCAATMARSPFERCDGQVLVEAEPAELGLRVDRQHLLRVQARSRARAAPRSARARSSRRKSPSKSKRARRALALDARHDPDLAGAALDLGRRHPQRVVERRHGAAELDHVAVAVLPVVEEGEVGGDLFEARRWPTGIRFLVARPQRCRRSRGRRSSAGRAFCPSQAGAPATIRQRAPNGGRIDAERGLAVAGGLLRSAGCSMEMPGFLGREGGGAGDYSPRAASRAPDPVPVPLRRARGSSAALHGVIVRA